MFKIFLYLSVVTLALTACQSVQEKNLNLIQDRSEKLKPLSHWSPTWCRVDAHLTQPALARYREMYPEESMRLDQESWAYTWKARKNSCEISALDPSPMTKNLQGFLETALCMLLQVHWVNSPFDQLAYTPQDVVRDKEQVHILASPDLTLGVFLDTGPFVVQTKTKTRGTLKVTYSEQQQEWLPARLEQILPVSTLAVDSIEYETNHTNGRRLIRAFWISVGEQKVLQHTQVTLSNCQNY